MIIALDYDKTYTVDPALWDAFMRNAIERGHSVVCITMRHRSEAIEMPCPVIYTGRRAKAPYAAEHVGKIDVWIDDAPHWIHQDSA